MMSEYTKSKGTDKLMKKSGLSEEGLEMVAKQAALAVDELMEGGWHPFLAAQIFTHAFFMTVHMARLEKDQIEGLINEQFTLVSEGVKVHIETHDGLGPLVSQPEGPEPGAAIIVPPRFKH